MSQILVGCDPEVFVKQGGLFKSAYGLIRGDKKNPQKIRRGAVQVDGMALEFNIDPAATEDEFCINVQDVFAQMCKMVPEYEVVVSPVANFDEAYMKAQPFEALELGCDPDFNAWEHGAVNQKPNGNRPMRTASGHVHIGWTNGADIEDGDHLNKCHMATRQLDFFLGLPSLVYDNDKLRREMYGKAGCYRPKSYGVEYRTLSNAWLKSETLMRWVFRNTVKGITELMQGNILEHKYGDIQEIINTSDVKKAQEIINDAGLEVCHG
jgi:Phage phiEco32-like COOH.NH2 ligase-type 2